MYKKVVVKGKGGISVTLLLDSVNTTNTSRIQTYELIYHRNIHAELMTHRMFSRNAASSRAIPFAKMKEQCTAMPIFYGKNQSGMQAYEALSEGVAKKSEYVINKMRDAVLDGVEELVNLGNHKQTYNRYLEPYQMIKTVVTSTSFDNWWWLRNHEAADPLIRELARCMLEAHKQSVPQVLKADEYHLPYVDCYRNNSGTLNYTIQNKRGDEININPLDAVKVSAARCAAVSFRNVDYDLKKSSEVWERLIGDERKHSSAMEHQAKVMRCSTGHTASGYKSPSKWEYGVSHMDRDGNLWSGNFKGWVQVRKLIVGEVCNNYVE